MANNQPQQLLQTLIALPQETEWVEFKVNDSNPEDIGEYLSALSNSAGLFDKEFGYIVWGVENKTHSAVGTTFKPRQQKIGNEELENWLSTHLHPRINFTVHEFEFNNQPMVIFEIQPCQHTPVRFKDTEWIRIGTYKKKLKDYPEKERALWLKMSQVLFDRDICVYDVTAEEVLKLIDYPAYFDLSGLSLPADRSGILERLAIDEVIVGKTVDRFDITNLGAVMFAKRLTDFQRLRRKTVRVIFYKGKGKFETIREREFVKGYAVGFNEMIDYITDSTRHEVLDGPLRREVYTFPPIAVRELVANMIIHQDFIATGTNPMVEIFEDRIEITNAGEPLIDPLRFIDSPPKSRNENLASFMRRLSLCEERGTGIDKVIIAVENDKLPPPEFRIKPGFTQTVLFANKPLSKMTAKEKIDACYQHACLHYILSNPMTNASVRERFGIEEKNSYAASRIINQTIKAGLIKPFDPDSSSRKHARYVPIWA